MDWTKTCIDHLISGTPLNLTGLDGSGRSRGLRMISRALNASDWTHLIWSPSYLTAMNRKAVRSEIESLYRSCGHGLRIPVLLIDDFGQFLMTRDGPWIERMLFNQVFEESENNRPFLRCVVVTHPRDSEIVVSGSGLRERSRYIHPPKYVPTAQQVASFGCSDADDLLLFTGCNEHLLSVGGGNPDTRRSEIRRTAREKLPLWIGQLDTTHQNRLGRILDRVQPPPWRKDDADPSLTPIAVPDKSQSPTRCAITACLEAEDLRLLLTGRPWPSRDLREAARRFSARCGSDPSPLWADNYLSDIRRLDFSKLVEFLKLVLAELPNTTTLRILSRNRVGRRRVHSEDIQCALRQAGISTKIESRLTWKLYDHWHGTNLHRRELILSKRGTAFSLPPVRIVVGQDVVGNETDAEVAYSSSAATWVAWRQGEEIISSPRGARA